MKKFIIISVIINFIFIISILIFGVVNYTLFDTRLQNVESEIKKGLVDTTELRNDIETINYLTKKFVDIDTKLENIETEKINIIGYLIDVALLGNEFIEYSKVIYDNANGFVKKVEAKGLHPVSIREISNIENVLDSKNREISNLTKKYNDLSDDYKELNKTLYLLTKN